MTEWVETETIRHGNCTITVHRPVLTASERKKRESQVQATLGRVMREYIHSKEEQHGKHNHD